MNYRKLQQACKERGLNAKGSRKELEHRLAFGEQEPAPEYVKPEPVKPEPVKPLPAASTDIPNPDNFNYDTSGRWRRRVRGWIGWDQNGKAIVEN